MDVLDRMGQQGHPEEDHLERYVMKTCSDQEKDRLEEHLLICEHCQDRLYSAEEWVALMKSAMDFGPKRFPLPRWRLNFGQNLTRPVTLAGFGAIVLMLCVAPALVREKSGDDEIVALSANRGGGDQVIATANSHKHLILKPDFTGLVGPFQFDVVDSGGASVFSQSLAGSAIEVRLDRELTPGTYWVRINSAAPGHITLRESGLRIQ